MSSFIQIVLEPHRPGGLRLRLTELCRILVTAAVFVGFSTALQAEVVDLRDGARTIFYGGFNVAENQGDHHGWAMAFGDVDGDGFTDFLGSTALSEGPNDEHEGRENDVYLFFGRPRAEIDSLYDVDAPGVADIIFYGGGFSMACEDLDNDGYDDVILAGARVIFGAPRDSCGPSMTSRSVILTTRPPTLPSSARPNWVAAPAPAMDLGLTA